MQKHKTNKLFYNKWPIKVECNLQGAYKIKRLGVDRTIKWCHSELSDKSSWYNDRYIDKVELSIFATKFKNLSPNINKENVQIRTEGNHFTFFLKDKTILEKIIDELNEWITCVTEPETTEENEFLIANGHKTVLCKHYPYGIYHYKVYIKESTPLTTREQFLTWLTKYESKINVTGVATTKWFSGQNRWGNDPFIYVEDNKTLTMVLLFLGNYIRKTQEYILRDDINIECPH